MIGVEDLDEINDPLELFRLTSEAISQYQEAIDNMAEIRARSMAALYARGMSYKELSSMLGLSTPRVSQLVSANDVAALEVINAWAAIERSIDDIEGFGTKSYREKLRALRRSDRFDRTAEKDLDYIREIRNAVVHGRRAVSPEEAAGIGKQAMHLNSLIRTIAVDAQLERRLITWDQDSIERLDFLNSSQTVSYADGWWSCSYVLSPVSKPPSLPGLRKILREIKGRETGWPVWLSFAGVGQGSTETIVDDTIESWFQDVDSADYWRANPHGYMYLLRRLQEDWDFPKIPPGSFIDLILPVWSTGECLLHVSRLASRLDAEIAEIEMVWHGLADRELRAIAGPSHRVLSPGKISHTNEVRERIVTPTADISNSLPRLVKSLVAPLYAQFDFFEPQDELYESELQRMRNGLRL